MYDKIVADASQDGFTSPWQRQPDSALRYFPDYATLRRLLGVPLLLSANSQSGVPALALDVWVAYELRRCGFEPDGVWPRASVPRVLPSEIQKLLDAVPRKLREDLGKQIARGKGIGSASANILGKNYVKQVDVVMSAWNTGPELLISTKRMDSSFGKNAANRVEESYGDAKNLRLRYPQAALGFLYGLRSTALTQEPAKAAWLIDLLAKLGEEDDAYHAVGLLILEWGPSNDVTDESVEPDEDDPLVAAGVAPDPGETDEPASLNESEVESQLAELPEVTLRTDRVPADLDPARLLGSLASRVLRNSPITFHEEARKRLEGAEPGAAQSG